MTLSITSCWVSLCWLPCLIHCYAECRYAAERKSLCWMSRSPGNALNLLLYYDKNCNQYTLKFNDFKLYNYKLVNIYKILKKWKNITFLAVWGSVRARLNRLLQKINSHKTYRRRLRTLTKICNYTENAHFYGCKLDIMITVR